LGFLVNHISDNQRLDAWEKTNAVVNLNKKDLITFDEQDQIAVGW